MSIRSGLRAGFLTCVLAMLGTKAVSAREVRPSGNTCGEDDDTDALQVAFTGYHANGDSAGVKPDGAVTLIKGTYLISRPIRIDLTKFVPAGKSEGEFRGRGIGKTRIRRCIMNSAGFPRLTLEPGADPSSPETEMATGAFVVYQEAGDPREYTFTAKGMTITAEGRTQTWHPGFNCNFDAPYGSIFDVWGESGRDPFTATRVNTNWLDLELNGSAITTPFKSYTNLNFALNFIGGGVVPASYRLVCKDGIPTRKFKTAKPLAGNHVVRGCSFSRELWAIRTWHLSGAQLTISDSSFHEVGSAYQTFDLDDSRVLIEGNEADGYITTVEIDQAFYAATQYDPPNDPSDPNNPILLFPRRSTVTMRANQLGAVGFPGGVNEADVVFALDWSRLVEDGGNDGRLNVSVRGNDVNVFDSSFNAITLVGVRGFAVADNEIEGSAHAAIDLIGSSHGVVRDNEVEDFTAVESEYFDVTPARILLRSAVSGLPYWWEPLFEDTNHVTVRACAPDVTNLGTDNSIIDDCD